MTNFVHPETLENEIFFTNCNADQFVSMKWTTKRKGQVAYNGDGVRLDITNWFPVFINQDELKIGQKDLSLIRKEFRSVNLVR